VIIQAGIPVIIEIVQQSNDAPQVLFRPGVKLPGTSAHTRLHRQGMLAQTFRLGELS